MCSIGVCFKYISTYTTGVEGTDEQYLDVAATVSSALDKHGTDLAVPCALMRVHLYASEKRMRRQLINKL